MRDTRTAPACARLRAVAFVLGEAVAGVAAVEIGHHAIEINCQTANGKGQITLLNAKPAVGFTLPWAGVTSFGRLRTGSAPSVNREMSRTPFRS
jgi:hypothetical protein